MDKGYHQDVVEDEMNSYLLDLHEDRNVKLDIPKDQYEEVAGQLAVVFSLHRKKML